MLTDKVKAHVAALFDIHPGTDRLFITSDGQVFLKQQPAQNHASTRKDKTVTDVYRPGTTSGEIANIKQREADLQQADGERAYRSIFPELAAMVDANASAANSKNGRH